VLEVDADRAGDVADREVTGQAVPVVAERLDVGRAEGDRRVGLGVEEVGAAQVLVAASWAVVRLATWRTTSAVEAVGSASSRWRWPARSGKCPRTLVTMAWRATKPTRLWAGSIE
jgi:hypothetical protein